MRPASDPLMAPAVPVKSSGLRPTEHVVTHKHTGKFSGSFCPISLHKQRQKKHRLARGDSVGALQWHFASFCICSHKKNTWPESANILHRPSDRRLSATWCNFYADSWLSRSQRDGSLQPYSRLSRSEPLLFPSKALLNCTHEAEWPFCRPILLKKSGTAGNRTGPLDL
jgi:hypothetical protein